VLECSLETAEVLRGVEGRRRWNKSAVCTYFGKQHAHSAADYFAASESLIGTKRV